MNQEDLNSNFSTQCEEIQEQRRTHRSLREMMLSLKSALQNGFISYKAVSELRSIMLQDLNNSFAQELYHIQLKFMNALFDVHGYLNTSIYARYVNRYQHDPRYIDYAVELPKIKHAILEQEVDWYIENLTEYLKIVNKGKCPSFFKPVLEQDPKEARHTRTVINHALEQLEIIATKITSDNGDDYKQNKERYTWCLAGMITLLPEEEQDPFKQNGIHQRWQNARIKIQQTDSLQ